MCNEDVVIKSAWLSLCRICICMRIHIYICMFYTLTTYVHLQICVSIENRCFVRCLQLVVKQQIHSHAIWVYLRRSIEICSSGLHEVGIAEISMCVHSSFLCSLSLVFSLSVSYLSLPLSLSLSFACLACCARCACPLCSLSLLATLGGCFCM